MPLLAELGGAFSTPVELSSERGGRFVELVAWLDFVACGHDRWFEWLPPLLWLRRGIMLRRVVRDALEKLVEKACADPKAAWAAIAQRRKELRKRQKDSYGRALAFTVDHLQTGLAERKVTCDADVVAATRVLTGIEHDDLRKKEEARAERAQAVMNRSAEARAELLLKEGYDALATKAPPRARIEAAGPVIEQAMEEPMATADDLAALREAR
jgi:hypothetical protein